MNKFVRSIALVATATVAAGSLAAGFGGTAFAGTPPPWEPDANSGGALVFFNAAGQQITGGKVTDTPIAAYVEGTTTVRAGDTKATLYGYDPVAGTAPGTWGGEALGSSTTYPNSGAPAPLKTATLPVETGSAGDTTVATLKSDFPNTNSVASGYAGLYQLRLKTTAPGKVPNTRYDSADILISGTTWSVVYPAAPSITSFAPARGPVGTTVIIKGANLKWATKVTFSGVKGTITYDTATNLKVKVPVGATTGKIKVFTPGGSVMTATVFTVT